MLQRNKWKLKNKFGRIEKRFTFALPYRKREGIKRKFLKIFERRKQQNRIEMYTFLI